MSALKNLLKSDTPTSNSGRISGEGSHFPKDDETSTTQMSQPTPATGTDLRISGAADTSAVAAPASQAKAPTASEIGGSEHAGTATTAPPPALPPVQSSRDGIGSAAIGETTTYSTQPLASGDPIGSVMDHKSTDPMTYKMPEVGRHSTTGNAGVPPEAASAAASAAWTKGGRMPGEFPTVEDENPYKASHPLDPRVDGGRAPESTPSAAVHTTPTNVASGAAAGVGAGATAAAASHAFKSDTSREAMAPAPSTLSTTADPSDRSAEYQKATNPQGLGSDPATASRSEPQPEQGFLTKALGAVGLAGATGATAAALGHGSKKQGSDEPHDTSAVATQPGQSSSETGPPQHYRRESIPTTAYPAGPNSPSAIAPPVGGTQKSAVDADRKEPQVGAHPAATAAVGGGAVAASQLDQSKELQEHTAGTQSQPMPQSSALGPGAATSGVYEGHHPDSGIAHESIATEAAPVADPSFHHQTTQVTEAQEDHRARNLAAGGAAAAAVGAGAYGVHEHAKNQLEDPTTVRDTKTASTVPPGNAKDTSPIDAVAAAPGRYGGQDATAVSTVADPKKEEDHSARNTAVGVGAGAAAAGGAAYAVDKHKEEEAARKAAAEREKELAKQQEHQQKEAAKAEKEHQKQLEKEQKQAEKDEKKHQKEIEKEHKQHQKEIEKDEKKHQKELEKEEKQHQKELEKEEKKHAKEVEKETKEREAAAVAEADRREKAQAKAEEEDRKRREREAAAAGVGVAATAGTAAAVDEDKRHGHDKDEQHAKHTAKEKKPSIFKRIFKRRKNKDTGEDEEYSTDDEEDKARHAAAAAAGTGTAGSAVAAAGSEKGGSSIPHHQSDVKGRNVLGRAPDRVSADLNRDPVSAVPHDPSRDPETAHGLGREPGAGVEADHRRTPGNALDPSSAAQPGDSVAGPPYESSKDSAAAHHQGHNPATAVEGSQGQGTVSPPREPGHTTVARDSARAGLPQAATEPFGEITDHRR